MKILMVLLLLNSLFTGIHSYLTFNVAPTLSNVLLTMKPTKEETTEEPRFGTFIGKRNVHI